ncbi:TonB-dependent receptor [Phenylobacterium sp. LjRoot219]|uniref:TonB-dependent receptor n=1 Tax=Phenylobacterium sp. LjRoot219 TaxID=3342283 RepID=UPI003ECD3EB4
MMNLRFATLASVSVLALGEPAWAQSSAAPPVEDRAAATIPELVVTARRRQESLQEAPLSMNLVTSEDLEKLNLRNFTEITSVIPGFQTVPGGATVRGIAFSQGASGNNPTIGFYLNDAPVPASDLFQTMFDIGQIELLRGPQGTLRGRASPSGALTLTTRRPSLLRSDGYAEVTGTDRGGVNLNAAVGVPIINDVLAVRLAGLIDEGEGTGINSIHSDIAPYSRSQAIRGTVVFEPMDDLQFIFTAQNYQSAARSFIQAESTATIPGFPFIKASDRVGLQDFPEQARAENTNYNLQAQYRVAGQLLNYVGQRTRVDTETLLNTDLGDIFGPGTPSALQGFGMYTETPVRTWAHELRLSSEDRVFGIFDYIVGVFYNELKSTSTIYNPFGISFTPPSTAALTVSTSIRDNKSEETSFFGNLTAHLGEDTELSGGVRHINYQVDAGLCAYADVPGFTTPVRGPITPAGSCVPRASFDQHEKFNTWIYTGSIKHDFSQDLMAYATIGSSWRPGIFAGGFPGAVLTDRQRSFLVLPPEKSTSYEIGVKSSLLDKRMRLNLAAFYQDFSNYPFRPTSPLFFVAQTASGSLTRFNQSLFVAAVPAKVHGVELEWAFAANQNWEMSANVAYAHSKISDGTVPCNDYFAPFGSADPGDRVPTAADIIAATGGQNIGQCQLSMSASTAPEWSANLQSEYHIPLSDSREAFVRGLFTWNGHNSNDPLNTIDSVKSYGLLNLYAGLRDDQGGWEVMLYGKNITNTERVLRRDSSPFTVTYVSGRTPVTAVAPYRRIGVNDPREFGLNARYRFGAR